jgi:hypothetical protein
MDGWREVIVDVGLQQQSTNDVFTSAKPRMRAGCGDSEPELRRQLVQATGEVGMCWGGGGCGRLSLGGTARYNAVQSEGHWGARRFEEATCLPSPEPEYGFRALDGAKGRFKPGCRWEGGS